VGARGESKTYLGVVMFSSLEAGFQSDCDITEAKCPSARPREGVTGDSNYILQGEDVSCALIALLNGFVCKYGQSPVDYPSKEFDMLRDIGLGNAGPILRRKLLAWILNVQLTILPTDKPYSLKAWLAQEVKLRPIMIGVRPLQESNHYILLTAWDGKGFLCANARWSKPWKKTEWIDWTDLEHRLLCFSDQPVGLMFPEDGSLDREKFQRAIHLYHEAMELTGVIE